MIVTAVTKPRTDRCVQFRESNLEELQTFLGPDIKCERVNGRRVFVQNCSHNLIEVCVGDWLVMMHNGYPGVFSKEDFDNYYEIQVHKGDNITGSR